MREDAAAPCYCSPVEQVVTCPECLFTEPVAVPFTISGKQYATTCPRHGTTLPQQTTLNKRHRTDSYGFTYCAKCGLCDETPLMETRPGGLDRENPNHYARLVNKAAGFQADPRRVRRALTQQERDFTRTISGVLFDADALCSYMEIKGAVKQEILRHVERFYRLKKRSGTGLRYEAVVQGIIETVATARAGVGLFDSVRLWNTYGTTARQRDLAMKAVASYFAEEGKKNVR